MVDEAAFAGFKPAKNRDSEMRTDGGSPANIEEWLNRGDLVAFRERSDEVDYTLRAKGPIQSILLQTRARK